MRGLCVALRASVLLAVCGAPALAQTVNVGELGQPRADLSASDLVAFKAGQQLFAQKLPTLGPFFNAEACIECHFIPTMGGSGNIEQAPYMGPEAVDKPAFYPKHALPGFTLKPRPANAGRRIPPPLYGLGLVEQIPDETIRAACGQGHPDPAKLQGSLPRNTIARFGVKSFLGTVLDFAADALRTENGVTNPVERSPDEDSYPDPEVDARVVENLAAFVRGLQPPGRDGNDAAGEAMFHSLGCATCHVPNMPPAQGVFSDFCVHHMGDALADGIVDHQAVEDEFRTTPLWGLRFKKVYLHDGRAQTFEEAIIAHGGEAQRAARAYQDASGEQRAALLRFLRTL